MSEYQKIKKNSLDFVSEKNNKFLNIYLGLNQLKNTLRTGWIKYHKMDEKYVESVADHSFATATMSYIIAKELKLDLDYEKLLKMALFHEIGEIKAGDIVSYKNRDLTEDEKWKIEKDGIEEIFQGWYVAEEIKGLWMEFEAQKTKEAKFVRSMDQLEAVFQAWVYQKNNLVGESVKEFKKYAKETAEKNGNINILEILDEVEL